MLYFGAQPGVESFYEKNGCQRSLQSYIIEKIKNISLSNCCPHRSANKQEILKRLPAFSFVKIREPIQEITSSAARKLSRLLNK